MFQVDTDRELWECANCGKDIYFDDNRNIYYHLNNSYACGTKADNTPVHENIAIPKPKKMDRDARYHIGDCVSWQMSGYPVYQGVIKSFVGNGVTIFDFETEKYQTILLSNIKEVIYSKTCTDCNTKWIPVRNDLRSCLMPYPNVQEQTIERHRQEQAEQKEKHVEFKIDDRVIWLDDNRLLASGKIEELRPDYLCIRNHTTKVMEYLSPDRIYFRKRL